MYGTCKVGSSYDWSDLLAPPQKREKRLLEHLYSGEGERLSCQILLTGALNGLEVHTCD